ncbi:MAG TPA: tetratricopeptide repeat protein [Kiloniellales bacterium]|nr:tetratricopeptide repeat protein [Kiloniellales bacterium]
MSDVFREVDEAVREGQIKQFMKRYGVLLGAVVVVTVVGIGGWQFWTSWRHGEQVESSDAYAAAMLAARQGKTPEALEALGKLADPAGGEVGTIAAFAQARILLGEGQRESAIRIWDAIAANDASGPIYRDVALLLSVMHQIGQAPAQELSDRLTPLTGETEPFRPLAQELQALLALDAGDTGRARTLLEALRDDPATTSDQKERVTQLLAGLPG